MRMTWHDLLFMHWPIEPGALRAVVPASLELDLYDGRAWLGVVPFGMKDVRGRCLPTLPGTGWFPELNVRTYVTCGGKPGVWFFSLDAASRLAVRGARRSFRLNYFDAQMSMAVDRDGTVRYDHVRTHRGAKPARFAASYRGRGDAYVPAAGSLEAFLTQRYCLYTVDGRGRPWRGDIHHLPWTLQPGEAELDAMDMTSQIGITLPDRPPLLHRGARDLDVLAWLPVRC